MIRIFPSKKALCAFSLSFFFLFSASLYAQSTEALVLRKQGFEAQKKGALDEAAALYSQAIDADAAYATPHNDLGVVYQRQGKLDLAEKSFLKALQIKPDYAGVYTNLALLYEERGDIPRSLAYWEKRSSMGDPDDPYVMKAKENVARLQELDALSAREAEPSEEEEEFLDYDKEQERLIARLRGETGQRTIAASSSQPITLSSGTDIEADRAKAAELSERAQARRSKKQVKKLVSRAKNDIYNDQYQDALDKLYEAKTIDPKVQFLDELIEEARSRSIDFELARASTNADLYKKAQLLEVEQAWYPPVPEPQAIKNYAENFKGVKKSPARLELERKALEIIPKIDFKAAQLKEVIEFLAVSNDINIVIDETVVPRNETVTIYLTNIPLAEALDIILRTKGLKYRFEENIIWITTEEKLLEEDLVVRVYDVQDLVGKLFDFPSKPFDFKPTVTQSENS
jgi:tetratricopeptide (TPR) repeat protein